MLSWLGENIGTILVCAALIAIVAAIIISMVKKKKRGKSMVCDCGHCASCPMSGSCHKQ